MYERGGRGGERLTEKQIKIHMNTYLYGAMSGENGLYKRDRSNLQLTFFFFPIHSFFFFLDDAVCPVEICKPLGI